MQNESEKYSPRRSLMLLSSTKTGYKIPPEIPNKVKKDKIDNNTQITPILERYESEITSISKMKEYKEIAKEQKESLFKENKNLKIKFSESLLETKKLEKSVSSVSNMISEFLQILQNQNETVVDMYSNTKDATDQIKQTENELILTIQRTKSHSNNLIGIILFFTVLLIFLDYLSK